MEQAAILHTHDDPIILQRVCLATGKCRAINLMLMTAFETAHLVIREAHPSDAEAFYAYLKREEYWRDLPMEPPTPASIAAMVSKWILDQAKEPRTGYFMAATDKASGMVIGEAILRVRSLRWRQGEIGWGISSDHTGQGFGTEIGFAILQLAFDNLGLHRVHAQCRPENHVSRRIMLKLGMREEGILRENVLARGSWWSSVQYSILATERTAQGLLCSGPVIEADLR